MKKNLKFVDYFDFVCTVVGVWRGVGALRGEDAVNEGNTLSGGQVGYSSILDQGAVNVTGSFSKRNGPP